MSARMTLISSSKARVNSHLEFRLGHRPQNTTGADVRLISITYSMKKSIQNTEQGQATRERVFIKAK